MKALALARCGKVVMAESNLSLAHGGKRNVRIAKLFFTTWSIAGLRASLLSYFHVVGLN
jgi:hypothetical protein